MLKLEVPVLPPASVAEQVTVVMPSVNVSPELASQNTAAEPSTRSWAVGGVNVAVAPLELVASSEKLAGVPDSVGGVVSTIVMLNEPFAVLPAASVAEQLTVVVPSENVLPLAGTHETAGLAGFASVAVAAYVTVWPDGLVASSVMSDGKLSTGGVESQLLTTAVTVRLWASDNVPPSCRLPVAVYAIVVFTEPSAVAANWTFNEAADETVVPFGRDVQFPAKVMDPEPALNPDGTVVAAMATVVPSAKWRLPVFVICTSTGFVVT
jgi:hypothetical protein